MLHDPARHEPLCDDSRWDAARALAQIQAIVDRTAHERVGPAHWRAHPLDLEGEAPLAPWQSLYLGSAGVLWALWWLQRQGVARLAFDPVDDARRMLGAWRQSPDDGQAAPSYLIGEVGIRLVLWRLDPQAEPLEPLFEAVRGNIANPTNEALWGAPGTMLAAWHLWQATGEARWRDLWRENAAQVWRTWQADEATGCDLWTQDMYGRITQYLGAGHGLVGNLHPLLKGAALLPDEWQQALPRRAAHTLGRLAEHEGEAVNWPPLVSAPGSDSGKRLMQWCHGAPGVVSALVDLPVGASPALDALLVGAGEATWQAGPLAKGHGLCHGTAGNGQAFLVLYRRTGDALWLDRARAFAMHAIAQSQAMAAAHGQGRHSLWNGDTGLAVYLWQCLDGTPGMPSLDFV